MPAGGKGTIPAYASDWLTGLIDWNALADDQKTWLRDHIEDLAVEHRDLFPDLPQGPMTGVEYIKAVNEHYHPSSEDTAAVTDTTGTDTTGTDTTGDGNKPSKPGVGASGLPGVEGKDYHFVKAPNGKVYVVYTLKTAGGKQALTGWRLEPDDLKKLGVNPSKVAAIGAGQFRQINVFGVASEITSTSEHPFKGFVKNLAEQYGHVSFLKDSEYMSVLVDGFLEGKDATTIQNMLSQTKWYQSKTDAERQWAGLTKAEKSSQLKNIQVQMATALDQLYGAGLAGTGWRANIDQKQLETWAKQISSGKLGNQTDGFNTWLRARTLEAQKVEGTNAWIDQQKEIESKRAFMNRPEDRYGELRQDALRWLGPAGKDNPMLSQDVLKQWAVDLTTGKKSDEDWQLFLEKKASNLYPYLGTGQSWMEFADPYKAKAEQLWGRQIDWSDPILGDLQGKDVKGAPTGAAVSFSDFETQLRSTPQFWQGPVAREEGFDLITKLDGMFRGVNY